VTDLVPPVTGIWLPSNSGPLSCKVFRRGTPSDAPEHLGDISEILEEPNSLVWVDVVDPREEDLEILQEEFRLHPLAIEDAVKAHQRPKIESYDAYWFVVVLGVTLTEAGPIQLHEISIFAADRFLVTVRHGPAFPLEEIEQRWNAHPERLRRGGSFLLYTILDTIVDGYFPILESFQERIDSLEEALFENQPLGTTVMHDIFAMRREGQAFRHAALPMRDILNPIIRGDVKILATEEIPYFRDVYDHSVRVIDGLDSLRDLLGSALEIHLSVVATRHNDVAKQLTVIATIFLPLSFLVGFFGQNFEFLVTHISGPGAFLGLGIGTEVATMTIMLLYFKRKGWF
jgi:magnesium transporter